MRRPGRGGGEIRADHSHDHLWTRRDQERYEDRASSAAAELRGEIRDLAKEVHKLGARLTWLLGGVAVVVAILSFVARYLIPPAGQ